jgi:hypothetical protein
MKKRREIITVMIAKLMFSFAFNTHAQQQITIVNTPTYYTPIFDDLYLSGNFQQLDC